MILAQQRRSHVAHACRCRYCTISCKQNCTIWALFTRLLLQCNCLVCIVSDGIKLVSLCGISRFCPVGTGFPTDVLSHDKCFMPSVLKFDWLNKLTLCVLFDTDFESFQFGDVSPALPLLIALLGCSETRPASVWSILSTCIPMRPFTVSQHAILILAFTPTGNYSLRFWGRILRLLGSQAPQLFRNRFRSLLRELEASTVRVLCSGVARNCRQGVRQSVAFLSVHSRSAALPSRPYSQKTSCVQDSFLDYRGST